MPVNTITVRFLDPRRGKQMYHSNGSGIITDPGRLWIDLPGGGRIYILLAAISEYLIEDYIPQFSGLPTPESLMDGDR